MKNEMYELVNRNIKTETMISKAWIYTRNLSSKKEQMFDEEKNMLLTSIANSNKRFESLVIDIADIAHRINKSMDSPDENATAGFAKLSRKVEQVIKSLDVGFIDPTGMILDDELLENVRIIGNIAKSDISDHLVGETLETIVTIKGRVIRSGEVIGWYPNIDKEQKGED